MSASLLYEVAHHCADLPEFVRENPEPMHGALCMWARALQPACHPGLLHARSLMRRHAV
jgi:hypothetical protein